MSTVKQWNDFMEKHGDRVRREYDMEERARRREIMGIQMSTLTIADAAEDLGLPLPGLTWNVGDKFSRELTRFMTEHSGHQLTAEAHDPVTHVGHEDPVWPMSLFCMACSAKLDQAVGASEWEEKLG